MSLTLTDPRTWPTVEDPCDQCLRPLPDRVGLSFVADDAGDERLARTEYGFCSIACLVTFVRRRWIEDGPVTAERCPATVTVLSEGRFSCDAPAGHLDEGRLHHAHLGLRLPGRRSGRWEDVVWADGSEVVAAPGGRRWGASR